MGFLQKLFGLGPKADLGELIAAGAVIIDVRTKDEYASGHVRGSLNIPLDRIPNNMGKIKSKEQTIITCCASGMRSGVAKSLLKKAGYLNVHNGGPWHTLKKYGK